MDLFEENEFLDQSLNFQDDQSSMIEEFLQDLIIANNAESDEQVHAEPAVADQSAAKEDVDHRISDDDMASVFLDWLRSNREVISVEDLRSIKIKKSTIETAARRLGGGKEAMKQLLKLVLEWVQTNHLTRQRSLTQPQPIQASDNDATGFSGFRDTSQNPKSGQILYSSAEKSNPSNNYYFSTPWSHSQPSFYDPMTAYLVPTAAAAPPPPPPPPQQQQYYPSPAGFVGDLFSTGSGFYPPESNRRVHVIDFSQSRPCSYSYPQYTPFPDHSCGFGSGHYDPNSHGQNYYNARASGGGEKRLGKLLGSSAAAAATKEARKKRMARQRSWLMMSSTHHQNQAVDLDLVKYSHRVPATAASTSTSSSTVASSSGPSNVDTSDFVPGGPSATEGREESEVSSTTEL